MEQLPVAANIYSPVWHISQTPPTHFQRKKTQQLILGEGGNMLLQRIPRMTWLPLEESGTSLVAF